jgi:hypothetical protein
LREQDPAELVDFDSRVVILQSFTNKASELNRRFNDLRRRIHDPQRDSHRAERPQEIVDQRGQIRRQAIVVLSDGEDTSSLLAFEEVLDLAKRSETAIHAIAPVTEGGGTGKGFWAK